MVSCFPSNSTSAPPYTCWYWLTSALYSFLQLHGAVIHAEDGVLHPGHAGGAEGRGQGVHMGVGQKCPADLHAGVGHGRAVGVKEVLLGLPIGVAGVAGVVDAWPGWRRCCNRQRHGSARNRCSPAPRRWRQPPPLRPAPCTGQQGIDVGAGVFHLAEFHGGSSFRLKNSVPIILTRLQAKKKDFELALSNSGQIFFVKYALPPVRLKQGGKKAYNRTMSFSDVAALLTLLGGTIFVTFQITWTIARSDKKAKKK